MQILGLGPPNKGPKAQISWFKRQSLTFMILKHRFNSFRDPWMGPKCAAILSNQGCACAPFQWMRRPTQVQARLFGLTTTQSALIIICMLTHTYQLPVAPPGPSGNSNYYPCSGIQLLGGIQSRYPPDPPEAFPSGKQRGGAGLRPSPPAPPLLHHYQQLLSVASSNVSSKYYYYQQQLLL